jgi:phage FluMu protein Com
MSIKSFLCPHCKIINKLPYKVEARSIVLCDNCEKLITILEDKTIKSLKK